MRTRIPQAYFWGIIPLIWAPLELLLPILAISHQGHRDLGNNFWESQFSTLGRACPVLPCSCRFEPQASKINLAWIIAKTNPWCTNGEVSFISSNEISLSSQCGKVGTNDSGPPGNSLWEPRPVLAGLTDTYWCLASITDSFWCGYCKVLSSWSNDWYHVMFWVQYRIAFGVVLSCCWLVQ